MPETIASRQWQTALDGISNLQLVTKQIPYPGPGEVLVKINSVSLNYKDGETIEGQFNHHPSILLPEDTVPCADAAGEVFIVGKGITKWKKGDRVLSVSYPDYLTGTISPEFLASGLGSNGKGVLCEYRLFEESALIPTPNYLTDDEACTLQIAGTTAWMSLNGLRPLGKPESHDHTGEVILLQGTGGVSIQGLLIAKASNATVIITSSSDEKLSRAKALGADHCINYTQTPAWDEEVLRLTHGKGVDIIFENGGAQTTLKSLNCIKFGGLINGIGYVTGKIDPPEQRTNINVLLIKRACIYKGALNGPRDRFLEMMKFYEERRIRPVVDRTFKFEEAREALGFMWKGGHFGKIVVKVSS